jgi:endonuclease/exonuclease/phosphatase family metal-dependent hydrolase
MRYAIVLAALLAAIAGEAAARELRIATWNLEWLMEPRVLRSLRPSCVPANSLPRGPARVIPCDVANTLERSSADFAALTRYARKLDADVVAIQEVDGPGPARRIFNNYKYCFSSRSHVQNLGFAIRQTVPYRCGADLTPLSLGDTVRRGVQLTLWPGGVDEIHLLAVHLKSGCGRRTLDNGKAECTTLAQQAPILKQWLDAEAAAGHRFAILGDFNRDLKWDSGAARNAAGQLSSLWNELDVPAGRLTLAANLGAYQNCSISQNFPGYIDQIVLGPTLAISVIAGSMRRVTYENVDAASRRLSDHCPVSIALQLQ